MLNVEYVTLDLTLKKVPKSRANLLNEAKRIINVEECFGIKKDSSLLVFLGQNAFANAIAVALSRSREQYEVLIPL